MAFDKRRNAEPQRKNYIEKYRKIYSRTLTAKSRSLPNGYTLYIMMTDSLPGVYKVGRASDPEFRARDLSGGFFDRYEVVKVYEGFGKHETLVHTTLAPFMISTPKKPKTEFFRIPYEQLVEKINGVVSQFEH